MFLPQGICVCSEFCLALVLRSLLKCLLDHPIVSLLSDMFHSSDYPLTQYLYCRLSHWNVNFVVAENVNSVLISKTELGM